MAVFQPLFYSSGRYSGSVDRKLLASMIDATQPVTNGVKISGVIRSNPGTDAMKVSYSGTVNTMSVSAGMCIILDNSTPALENGAYLAGIYGSAETAKFTTPGSARIDTVYAIVDPTEYTITNRDHSVSGSVTFTTSASHGFKVGQTVFISGVDDIYNGAYVITATPAATTFTVAKSGTNGTETITAKAYKGSTGYVITNKTISSNVVTLSSATHTFVVGDTVTVKGVDSMYDGTYKVSAVSAGSSFSYVVNKPTMTWATGSVSTSSVAKASVPFYIGIDEGNAGTFNSKMKIKLASYSLGAGATSPSTIWDARTYTYSLGGIHINDTSTQGVQALAAQGRVRYDSNLNKFQFAKNGAWNDFLSIGTTSTTAAAGNHTHTGYSSTSHTHTSYAAIAHKHTLSQVGGTAPSTTYVDGSPVLPTPKSVGVAGPVTCSSSSNVATVTAATLSITNSSGAACYGLVEYSGELTLLGNAPTNTYWLYISGGFDYSSTNGTAYGESDQGESYDNGGTAVFRNQYPVLKGRKYIQIPTGTSTITLTFAYQAIGLPDTAHLGNIVLRVIPISG